MTKDAIGDRMKRQYEDRTRFSLPRRTHTIIRIDGKAFRTYTRGCAKPFDYGLMDKMDRAAIALCEEAQGVRCAYGQSDEYSFLLTDFETPLTEAWFDGNIQKMCSVAASAFTAGFDGGFNGGALFDARIFTIPDAVEVENYFIWRQQDATRNAIQMVGNSEFSAKELHQVNCDQIQEKLFRERGINFNDFPVRAKRGRVIFKEIYLHGETERSRWSVDQSIPIFTQKREYMAQTMRIPSAQVFTEAIA